jgi:predicted RNA binding protein YcfA (HicA-like mRNA interferase family)
MDSSNPNYGKSIPVPNHPVVERGVLMSIIRQSGLSKTEFIESLD